MRIHILSFLVLFMTFINVLAQEHDYIYFKLMGERDKYISTVFVATTSKVFDSEIFQKNHYTNKLEREFDIFITITPEQFDTLKRNLNLTYKKTEPINRNSNYLLVAIITGYKVTESLYMEDIDEGCILFKELEPEKLSSELKEIFCE